METRSPQNTEDTGPTPPAAGAPESSIVKTQGFARVPSPGSPRIALVAGEASGDCLGAGLIDALRSRFPDAKFAGIGGTAMRATGLEAWHDCAELSVMGLAEVLRHLPRLFRLRWRLRRRLLRWRPDVFIGIDAPDFNLGLERQLRAAGIRTVHYVSPSIWAWRERRAARIGHSADRVLCLFPNEPPIYARFGVDARFVGHPLADMLPLHADRTGARDSLGIARDTEVLAVLPGSRLGEIARLAPTFLSASVLLGRQRPGLCVLIPASDQACHTALKSLLSDYRASGLEIRLLHGRAHEAMTAADAVLLASGTAALEAMLIKRPMVVAYRIAPLTAWLVRRLKLLRTHRYSLPNVLAGEALVPELMQEDCTAGNIAASLRHWFDHPEHLQALTPRFMALHEQLRGNASEAAATAVAELLR